MDWRKKNVLVAGCGISGISAALLLESKGTRVFLYDENEKADTAKIREKLGMDSQAQVLIGALPKEVEDNIELVVLSPGVPLEASFAVGFRKRQIPIIGEIELAWLCGKGRVIAITGTNGKTTTTALCGKIMEDYF